MKKICAIFSVFFLLVLPLKAQWKYNESDTTLRFQCDYCPKEARLLISGLNTLKLGDAYEVDLVYLDYTSSPVYTREGVQLDGSEPEQYSTFAWFITNAYGWIEMTVHYPGGTFDYVVPTIQAYEAEKLRGY